MRIVNANSGELLGKISLSSGESITFTTLQNNKEVITKIDLIRLDKSLETYYLKVTNKGNLLMNKNLREKEKKDG